MKFIVTSDVHLGSPHMDAGRFASFLTRLPPETDLVLAGDVLHGGRRPLPPHHAALLGALVDASRHRAVTWIRGNHDERAQIEHPGDIRIVDDLLIPGRLYIAHGHRFDNMMPRHRWFIHLVRGIHWLRIRLGAESVHVARYAKRFPALYDVLKRHVRINAIQHAKECGVPLVICGHTHFAERQDVDGITYLNVGAWTEETPHAVRVTDHEAVLCAVAKDGAMT